MKLMNIFERVGLYKNLGKKQSMKCIPGFIWAQMGKETYKRRTMGEGDNFWEWKQTMVSCGECGVTTVV